MKTIPVQNSECMSIVDDIDYDFVSSFKWFLKGKYVYTPVKAEWINQTWTVKGQPPEGFVWDHVDGNPLNNTRSNLRLATQTQNQANMRPHKDNSSGYKNVRYVPECKNRVWAMDERSKVGSI